MCKNTHLRLKKLNLEKQSLPQSIVEKICQDKAYTRQRS